MGNLDLNRLFKVAYYVPGMGRMECAVRESQLVAMLSALMGSGFPIESASVWRREEGKGAEPAPTQK